MSLISTKVKQNKNKITPDLLFNDFINDLNKLEINDLIYAKTSDYVKQAKDLIGKLIKRIWPIL